MKFGIFYEHQIPRPWDADAEDRIYREALEQVELADRVGIDYAWEVEHHFLEEYSHSSAPEVFLAACSQRTKRIRLGQGIVLMPPAYNHPARVVQLGDLNPQLGFIVKITLVRRRDFASSTVIWETDFRGTETRGRIRGQGATTPLK